MEADSSVAYGDGLFWFSIATGSGVASLPWCLVGCCFSFCSEKLLA